MDRGAWNPPGFPLPNPLWVPILCARKEHMRQFIIAHFGPNFYTAITLHEEPIVLPIVTYSERWHLAIHVLY